MFTFGQHIAAYVMRYMSSFHNHRILYFLLSNAGKPCHGEGSKSIGKVIKHQEGLLFTANLFKMTKWDVYIFDPFVHIMYQH